MDIFGIDIMYVVPSKKSVHKSENDPLSVIDGLIRNRKYNSGIICINNVLLEYDNDDNTKSKLFEKLGICYSKNGEHTKAVDSLEKAINYAQEKDYSIVVSLSTVLSGAEKYNEALTVLNYFGTDEVQLEGMVKFDALKLYASLYFNIDDLDKALDYSRRLVNFIEQNDVHPYDESDVYFQRALIRDRCTEFPDRFPKITQAKVLDDLNIAFNKNPNHPYAYDIYLEKYSTE